VFIKGKFKACVQIDRVDFADDERPKILQEVLHTHVKRTIFRALVVVELISERFAPFV
jgi:hypothetical protein